MFSQLGRWGTKRNGGRVLSREKKGHSEDGPGKAKGKASWHLIVRGNFKLNMITTCPSVLFSHTRREEQITETKGLPFPAQDEGP